MHSMHQHVLLFAGLERSTLGPSASSKAQLHSRDAVLLRAANQLVAVFVDPLHAAQVFCFCLSCS